ncbi:2-hydroxyacid dehydrogenase [Halovulum sp. GXIMD14794]
MIGPIAILEPLAPRLIQTVRALAGEDLEFRVIEDAGPEAMRAALRGAPYAITRGVALPEEVLAEADALQLIHQWGTGVDGIPVAQALGRGMTVARCPGVNAPSVADLTIALMLSALRKLPQTDAGFRAGHWHMPELWDEARDLAGMTVGLLGFGAIGQAVARRLQGFDCNVRYWRRSGPMPGADARFCEVDVLLAECDVVSVHMPLTEGTRDFLSTERLASMKQGAVLVNTSRGGLVDETALLVALRKGPLSAAGLDVFAEEPTPADNPLLRLPNVAVTPHVGGRTRDNLHRMVRYWAANIRRHAAGEPIPEGDLVRG